MTKPKFIVSGATMAVAVLAIVVFSTLTTQKPVSAAELTQQGLAKLSQMSPDDLHELDLRVNGDPKAELEAAKQAKDLHIMSYDEYSKQDQQGVATQASDDGSLNHEHPDFSPKNLQYLRYTSSDGAVHTIGVNKQGLPVFIMVFRQNEDGSTQGAVRVEAGGSGAMTNGPVGQGTAGMTTCATQTGGDPVCTNSDGSPAPTPECQTLADGSVMCSAHAGTNSNQ